MAESSRKIRSANSAINEFCKRVKCLEWRQMSKCSLLETKRWHWGVFTVA